VGSVCQFSCCVVGSPLAHRGARRPSVTHPRRGGPAGACPGKGSEDVAAGLGGFQ